jgi:hypothetical protein
MPCDVWKVNHNFRTAALEREAERMRYCPVCGKMFVPAETGYHGGCCSPECLEEKRGE